MEIPNVWECPDTPNFSDVRFFLDVILFREFRECPLLHRNHENAEFPGTPWLTLLANTWFNSNPAARPKQGFLEGVCVKYRNPGPRHVWKGRRSRSSIHGFRMRIPRIPGSSFWSNPPDFGAFFLEDEPPQA